MSRPAGRMRQSILDAVTRSVGGVVLQTAANSATRVELSTGISTVANYAWIVMGGCWGIEGLDAALVQTADCYVRFGMRQGPVADYTWRTDDENVVWSHAMDFPGIAASTTSYSIQTAGIVYPVEDVIIFRPQLTMGIDSVNLGAVLRLGWKLYYKVVEISELDLLRLIAD